MSFCFCFVCLFVVFFLFFFCFFDLFTFRLLLTDTDDAIYAGQCEKNSRPAVQDGDVSSVVEAVYSTKCITRKYQQRPRYSNFSMILCMCKSTKHHFIFGIQ